MTPLTTTIQYRVWQHVRAVGVASPLQVATETGESYASVRCAMRNLLHYGHLQHCGRRGREAVYRATDLEPLQASRKVRVRTPRRKAGNPANGYGTEKCLLWEVWR